MEDMEDDGMAAAMGFSSFGAAPRKRKYDNTGSPPRPTANSSSGANNTRLGARPKMAEGESDHVQDASGGDDTTVVESTETAPDPATNAKGKLKQPAATGLASFLRLGQTLPDTLPEKPAQAPTDHQDPRPDTQRDDSSCESFGGRPVTKAELNALRQGVRNGEGVLAYFLPSFVVKDPWARLKDQQK